MTEAQSFKMDRFEFIKRGPTLLPVAARIWIALFVILAYANLLLFKGMFSYQLSGLGIVIGVFAAGILYWETVITSGDAIALQHQIAKGGNSRNLSAKEMCTVVGLFLLGFLMFIILTTSTLATAKILRPPTGNFIMKFLTWSFAASFAPPLGGYIAIKSIRTSFHKVNVRTGRQTDNEKNVSLKEGLRKLALITILAAGLIQYAAIIFSSIGS